MRLLAVAIALLVLAPGTARAASVTLVGDLQSELGCPSDWDASCAATHLTQRTDGAFSKSFSVPAGMFSYKVALNDSFAVTYGAHGTTEQRSLNLAAPATVRFYFDPVTHWVADSRTDVIATVVGDFQSELGCPADFAPDCLRSWIEDVDGDGIHRFSTVGIPPGSYKAKVAVNESFDENYGAGGKAGGTEIPFTVTKPGETVYFRYDAASHVLFIGPTSDPVPVASASPAPSATVAPSASPIPTATTVADTTAPTLMVKSTRSSRRAVRRRGVPVTVTADEAATVAWTASLPGRRLGRGSFAAVPGTVARRLKLSGTGAKAVQRRRPKRLTLTLTATDAAGNQAKAVRVPVRLKR